ncbi:CocE/NonD family hydrolase [Pseudonocardia sp. GCM10023141]|uniref:CocE/NonD family hydrolase n=1 Tax=Pseudonocardia sp. GCM10023141 TaxID=3252653 RepID=UPI00360B243E
MTVIAQDQVERIGQHAQRQRVAVAMRDGVELAADVYWPTGERLDALGPHPVLLERSPYDVRAMRGSDGLHASGEPVSPESGAAYFVERGYVVVRQDCRGQGASGGAFSKYVNEADDGYDTHEWVAGQPWCDGRIVTHGVSYSAHTQAAAASVGARHLVAMIMDSGGFSSAFDAGGRFGGAFELKQAVWSMHRAEKQLGTGTVADIGAWFAALPWRRGFSPLTRAQDYEDFLFDQWSHEDLDEYWTQPGLYARGFYGSFPAVPVLNISSWYDPYVFTAVENFRELRRRHAGTALVLGPWTHGARSVSWAGDVDFGPAATLDGNLAPDYLAFKDRWLRSVHGVGPAEPAVRYFLMGGGSGRRNDAGRLDHGGRWCTSSDWPPPGAHPVDLHLGSDQSLHAAPPPSGALSYDFDPHDPVPSRGGGITSGEPLMRGGAFDQTGATGLPLSARHDVLTFQTEPLPEPVTVAGRVAVHLRFSSSAPDTDVAVKLVDVHPPTADHPHGYAMNITDGMLRCRHRDDPAHPTPLEPGRAYDLVVPMPDTANVFGAGHRIRLDVTSSNFPRCDVNPNTGGPVMGARTFTIARNTVHTGASFLRLDVLPVDVP